MYKCNLAAAFISLILLSACADKSDDSGAELSPAATGQVISSVGDCGELQAPAREFEEGLPRLLVHTLDCEVFDLDQQRGSWVLINFWATWCAPCLKEIPDFNAMYAGEHKLKIIGLAYEEISVADMRIFFAEKVRPDYPVAIIDTFSPPADFDSPRGLPTTILINPEGRIARQFVGPVTAEMLLGIIELEND